MDYFLNRNRFVLSITIMFFVNTAPVTMQEIEGLESLISSSLDRLLGAIDPTIDKFQNAVIEILSVFEDHIKTNISETLYWLETNLLVLLFAIIVFFIFICILLNLVDILLVRYGYLVKERRFVGLIVITVIFIWLFIAMILSTWSSANKIDLQILKYVFVGILSLVILYFIISWISYFYTHQTYISDRLKILCGCATRTRKLVPKTPLNTQEEIELTNGHF